ncbi:MAG TPA: dTDP-4-dehydrorhamnose reductase [Candidatus Binatia bacterium]|nr:dTDP-4-dehydrorhamnose reductase [Candidatus Binatia bacterium]
MKVAVIGGNGQLGRDVGSAFSDEGHAVTSLSHQEIEVSSQASVRESLEALRPELVVNTSAFHHVEKCEADPAHAFAINGIGARNLAQVTQEMDATLMHISTDYVFDGRKKAPYTEEDAPAPLNVYGNTKLSGEQFVRSINPRHFVVRTSAIYGENPCRAKGGLNFVELMLKLSTERSELRVVDDEFVTPTPTTQIAQQLVALGQTSYYGLYHATAEGSCSWYEFAAAIFALTKTNIRLEPARPGEFPVKVARPKFSVLENQALNRRSLNTFTHWKEGLERYLARRAQSASLISA